MSFLRMAPKQSPLNSRMRSGKRMLNGLNKRSGQSAVMSWTVSAKGEQALLDEYGVLADLELLDHELLQALGHLGVELEADDVATTAALQSVS